MRILSTLLVAALVTAMQSPGVAAADIKVLTAGAMRGVVVAMQPAFEQTSGHKLQITADTAGGLAKRIAGGEPFDLAVITPAVIDDLIKQGKIAGSRTDIARVEIGVAVKEGAPAPDISTTAAFKAALLAAKSVAYVDPKAGGSSGIYFDKLIERLGIADAVRGKAKLKQGGYVAELVANGEAEMVVQQISEIVPVKGVRFVGPLPKEIQNTTVYSAGVAAASAHADAVRALIARLTGPDAGAVLSARGMEKP